MKAPLPDNETARIKALNDCKILDTEPESAFDDITQLAASICETPIAIVSFVDVNRQWFKSKVGLEITQMSRDISFCAHAILQPDVFIVADTLADQRFATNPLVTSDPNIRFYAGVPLITSENQALGTLNVIDQVPRKLNPQQIQALYTLGRQIVNQIELRRKISKLEPTSIKSQQTKKELQQFLKKIAIGMGLVLAIVVTVALSYWILTSFGQPDDWNQDYNVLELKEIRNDVDKAVTDARITIVAFASGIILNFLILFVHYLRHHKIVKCQLIVQQQANEQLSCWVDELKQRNHEITLINELSDVLQACITIEEAYTAIAQLLQPLFPESVGGLFLINASKNLVEAVAIWGSTPLNSEQLFAPDDCWALRRGRSHLVAHSDNGLLCNHVHQALPGESLCVPMMAQGEALGVLYLSFGELGQFTAAKEQLAKTVAENIALALANLKRHQTLHNQSIRDPLTGLFNRRYMEETLEREVQRCDRKQRPLSIVMIDLDYFKRFNDTFGHEAGDTVLQEIAHFLQKFVRGSDIACRYGGEEFILILPEASLEVTHKRAEQLREGIKHLKLEPRYYAFGSLTLSIGIASFPEHGLNIESVIRAADAALYRAKNEGRDAIRLAS